MSKIVGDAGFILADLKLEFGKLDGKIKLADSIGPDEYRLWPAESYLEGKVQESYDKQILRDGLQKTVMLIDFQRNAMQEKHQYRHQYLMRLLKK